jgi:hypothetical protein
MRIHKIEVDTVGATARVTRLLGVTRIEALPPAVQVEIEVNVVTAVDRIDEVAAP